MPVFHPLFFCKCLIRPQLSLSHAQIISIFELLLCYIFLIQSEIQHASHFPDRASGNKKKLGKVLIASALEPLGNIILHRNCGPLYLIFKPVILR